MMSSKHVEQSSAAAIASRMSSLTSPWIDVNLTRTFRATCARAQQRTMNAELIKRSDIDISAMFASAKFCAKKFLDVL